MKERFANDQRLGSIELRTEMRERGLSLLLMKKIICKFPSALKTNLFENASLFTFFMIATWLKEVLR